LHVATNHGVLHRICLIRHASRESTEDYSRPRSTILRDLLERTVFYLPLGTTHLNLITDRTTQYDNPLLAALPRIGGPDGISPSTVNDRIMECFGSTFWPEPLLPTDAAINAAKGRLMGFQAATGVDTIITLAKAAVLADDQATSDLLLQAIRVGFAVFDYIKSPDGASKWNLVRHQVYVQFGYIENVYGVSNLQQWWLLFSADYFVGVQEHAQRWADQAITAAAAEYLLASEAGHVLTTQAYVMNTLKEWSKDYVPNMILPDSSSIIGAMPLPQSP